ncbi:uncharacterized protein LOC132273949 [Cornus florida]|uniref:uncharacterized protein LOC132273949 n=1 Tax=Cornus florida TaxID=4283 RepID=UPI00289FCAB5|nr:uncharacterized protein LOC132273949 [Cornus florida]
MKQHRNFNAIIAVEKETEVITPVKKLKVEEVEAFDKMVSAEEIKGVIMSFNPDKSPGPDGFLAQFFQTFWSVVGTDVIAVVQSFFSTSVMPMGVSSCFLTLIPKVGNAKKLGEFIPIALCNLLYKVITKIMANRLSVVLSSLVGPEQSAFMKGRRIQDALILAHEMVKDFKGPNHASMALKVDIKKAYDSVFFLLKILKGYGFSEVWIAWISNILTSTRYSVLINGSPHGFIQPASVSNAKILGDLFKKFEDLTGLQVSPQKSSIIFSRVVRRKQSILRILNCSKDHFPIKYLGLPLCFTGLKKAHCQGLIDKISNQINCWEKSKGGFGLRKLMDIQDASKVVLTWDFFTSKDRLSVAWFKNKYTPHSNYWTAIPKVSYSAIWKSVAEKRDIMLEYVSFRIGTGSVFSFQDPWCNGLTVAQRFSHRVLRSLNVPRTAVLNILMRNGGWDLNRLQGHDLQQLREFLGSVVIYTDMDKLL